MKIEASLFSGNCFFRMREQTGFEPVITVCAGAADAVQQYRSFFGEPSFSLTKEAAAFLRKQLSDAAEICGYVPQGDFEPILLYRYAGTPVFYGGDAKLFGASHGHRVSLLLNPADYLSAVEDRFAAILRDGAIVSAACASKKENGIYEITVETDPRYRKCGFASACIAALAAHLQQCGYDVEYRCRQRNTASAKAAEKAGFVLVEKQLSLYVKDAPV